jgi:GH25 family lysozyme M1 (1,4-beta-N-acetylmuramidase)
MTERRAQGIDISHHDNPFSLSLATQPIDFVIQKLTDGAYNQDTKILYHWFGVKDVPVRGAYHYQRIDDDWLTQAQKFRDQVQKFDYQIIAIDVEKINNHPDKKGNLPDRFYGDTRRIIDYLRGVFTSKKVILYTNPDIYDSGFVPAFKRLYGSAGIAWLESCDLWLAQYWNDWKTRQEPRMPTFRKTPWRFWQYTDQGQPNQWGTSSWCDLNVFNGTPDDLRAWLASPNPPAPTTTNDDAGHIAPIVEPDPATLSEEPIPNGAEWIGEVMTTLILRSAPRVDASTDTHERLKAKETVTGFLWFGNDFIWMKINSGSHLGKWIATRPLMFSTFPFVRLTLMSEGQSV